MNSPTQARHLKTHLKLGAALLLFAMVIVFTIQNVEVVQVRFFFWTVEMSRSLLIFSILASGVVLGWILAGWLYVGRMVAK